MILGAIGAVLPLLPAFPFLLLATVCYAKSSERLHNWFINTKLYKNNLESFVQGNGMSWPVKDSYHDHGNDLDEHRFYYDGNARNLSWLYRARICMAIPYLLFLFSC